MLVFHRFSDFQAASPTRNAAFSYIRRTYRDLCVCMSAVLDTLASCAKTDEAIEMLFGDQIRVPQRTLY